MQQNQSNKWIDVSGMSSGINDIRIHFYQRGGSFYDRKPISIKVRDGGKLKTAKCILEELALHLGVESEDISLRWITDENLAKAYKEGMSHNFFYKKDYSTCDLKRSVADQLILSFNCAKEVQTICKMEEIKQEAQRFLVYTRDSFNELFDELINSKDAYSNLFSEQKIKEKAIDYHKMMVAFGFYEDEKEESLFYSLEKSDGKYNLPKIEGDIKRLIQQSKTDQFRKKNGLECEIHCILRRSSLEDDTFKNLFLALVRAHDREPNKNNHLSQTIREILSTIYADGAVKKNKGIQSIVFPYYFELKPVKAEYKLESNQSENNSNINIILDNKDEEELIRLNWKDMGETWDLEKIARKVETVIAKSELGEEKKEMLLNELSEAKIMENASSEKAFFSSLSLNLNFFHESHKNQPDCQGVIRQIIAEVYGKKAIMEKHRHQNQGKHDNFFQEFSDKVNADNVTYSFELVFAKDEYKIQAPSDKSEIQILNNEKDGDWVFVPRSSN